MDNIQSNTKTGAFQVLAGEALTGYEGRLVKIVNDGGVAKVKLPEAVTDVAAFVLLEGAASGSLVTVEPLVPGKQVRIVAVSTSFVAGDKVIAYASGHEGKATEYSGSGAAFIPAIALETGATAGQYLLCMPILSYWTA